MALYKTKTLLSNTLKMLVDWWAKCTDKHRDFFFGRGGKCKKNVKSKKWI